MDKEYTPAEAKAWLNGYDEGKKFAGREWVGLTEDEKEDMLKGSKNAYDAVERIEAKLKEKNLTSERSIQTSDSQAAESSQP